MSKILNKELLYRIISALVFIPIVVLPLIFSYYVSVFVYLIFLSLILNEIFDMNKRANKKLFLNIYSILTSFSFFIFLIFLITEKLQWYYLLLIILTIWLFDTFSYIGGKIIGGRKLMPKISSGKTISGLITGFLSTLLIIEIFLFRLLDFDSLSLLLIFIIIISSFLGDTIVSMLKRFTSVKDSGRIMPGHGGLLDRFDSFIMVFFVIGIFYLII
tara:strand:- start:855 stop:1502 length:648 start_codon:yes stop_codon:yes gene_type:complete